MSNKAFAISSIVVTTIFVVFIGYVLSRVFADDTAGFASVAALILVGLAAFIGIMNILSATSHFLGIADPRQPFGLPEGTVRAILTIAFIVLVGVLASHLLTQTDRSPYSEDDPIVLGQDLSATEAQALLVQYAAQGLVIRTTGSGTDKFNVQFRPRNDYRTADDIAKQILTILSTILAAMIGFYFGARPSEAQASAANPDAAERARLTREVETLSAHAPSPQTIRATADSKLAAVTDQQKRDQIAGIKAKLTAAETKLEAARKILNDSLQAMDKVRAAANDGKAAIQEFDTLNQQLAQITTP